MGRERQPCRRPDEKRGAAPTRPSPYTPWVPSAVMAPVPTVDRQARPDLAGPLCLQRWAGNAAVSQMLVQRLMPGDSAAPAAMASRVVEGDAHYRYEQFANGDIVIVAGPARVGERHAKGDRVNQAITAEIERKHGPFPTAATAPDAKVAPVDDDGGLLPSLDAILATVGGAGGALVDTGVALIDDLTSLVRSTIGLVGGTSETPASPEPAGPVSDISVPPSSPGTAGPDASGTSVDANLAEAKKLADEMSIGHSYDHDGQGKHGADETVIVDELQAGVRRDAIIGGQADQLQTILCSEFTNLTLAKMGVDLSKRYLVPGDRLPLGYPENGSVTFLTLYMVTNNQRETTAALIDHQNKLSRRVAAGSQKALDLGCENEAGDFYVVDKGDIVGMAVSGDNEFGAGATAVSMGGRAIPDPADRKPGDLQQSLKVDASGQTSGLGHSSQVWTVFGDGVACLGQPGSPTVVGGTVSAPGPIETLSGWYALPPGKLKWEVGPGTDPALVAKLTCVEFQLIEANVGNANDDATGVGEARVDKSEVVSNGRLPDSKWITWEPRDEQVKGTLS